MRRNKTLTFGDALIAEVACAHGAAKIVTFDKVAAKLPMFELLPLA